MLRERSSVHGQCKQAHTLRLRSEVSLLMESATQGAGNVLTEGLDAH